MIQGDVENGTLMSGQIAGLIREVKPAGMIIEEIVSEAELVISRLSRIPSGVING